MQLRIPLFQIDAFTNTPFEGNPAAVCFLPSSPTLPDSTLQAIAAENNLSETAFLQLSSDNFASGTRFNLRWFTPEIEVPLCGHATLASAAAIFACTENPASCVYFDTLSGELSVRKIAPKKGLQLAMDLPLLAASPAEPFHPDFALNSAVIDAATNNGALPVEDVVYEPSLRYLVIVLQGVMTQQQFEALQPNIDAMHAAHTDGKLVGVILTVAAAQGSDSESCRYDFYSRFFGPWAGIAEDPVTGSAHSVLGPYWAKKLGGKMQLCARQCSKRGGDLSLEVNGENGRVVVSGGAVVVIKGELLLEDVE